MKNRPFPLIVISFLFIFRISAQTFTTVSTFAGTGVTGHLDNPVATSEFNIPYGICTDTATGDFYISDPGNQCIRKISNGIVSTFAGSGIIGDVDAQGINASFNGPSGVTFFNGYLYLTDNGNNKIKKIDALGNVTTIAGTGTAGYLNGVASQANFYGPSDLVVTASGDIYVTDYLNNCIRKISGGIVTTYAGSYIAGDILGVAVNARFNRPRSICIDAAGNFFLADMGNNKIKEISSAGVVTFIAGNNLQGNQNGTGASARFNSPTGIDVDLTGNLVVVESGNNDVRGVTWNGVVTTIAGNGSAGFNNGPTASATFNSPAGVCVASDGSIYIADILNNVIRTLVNTNPKGIEENKFSFLSIYPNPSSENLIILNPSGENFLEVQILGVDGKLIDRMNIENSSSEIKIEVVELPAGIYFITATTGKSKKYFSRFIKE